MKEVFYVLFGAVLTTTTCTALGLILFRLLRLRFNRGEQVWLGFVTGSALLSGIVFLLCTVHEAQKGVFLAVAGLAIAGAIRLGAYRTQGDSLPPIPAKWRWVLCAVMGVFGFLYFTNAMAPEMSPDGSAYHLVFPAAYHRAHGFVRIPWNIYANLSQGIELLFLFAYSFGRHSAAALVHFSYLVALPWLMIAYARRAGITVAGIAGALFCFVSPVVGIDGSVAYVDVALATILFALFFILQIWDEQRNARLLIPAGILAGFAFAVKYTAFLAVVYAVVFVAWKLWRSRQRVLRPVLALCAVALLFIVPWPIKNLLWMQNPLAPFGNRLFPNPFVHISFEEEYTAYLRNYALTDFREIPWQLTVDGYKLVGLFGPLYLLTPLALLALRKRQGRQILLAGAVFTLPYVTNIGARFLIPAAPYYSLALAMAFAQWEWVLMALLIAHSVLSWPDVVKKYCSPYAWRLVKAPYREALRIIPSDQFLRSNFPAYKYNRRIEEVTPPNARIFSFGQPSESYMSRQILVKYLAAPNEVLADILLSALYTDLQPSYEATFRFAPHSVRKLRLINGEDLRGSQWSVTELRCFRNGSEIPRSPAWRLTASPNPWDVQLAFDNSPVTRWKTWEPAKPGMYVEIDFGKLETVDEVQMTMPPDWSTKRRVEGLDESGKWVVLNDHPQVENRPLSYNLRRMATQELKARGVDYILVGYDDLGSEDFQQHPDFWGIRMLFDEGYARLYYIQ